MGRISQCSSSAANGGITSCWLVHTVMNRVSGYLSFQVWRFRSVIALFWCFFAEGNVFDFISVVFSPQSLYYATVYENGAMVTTRKRQLVWTLAFWGKIGAIWDFPFSKNLATSSKTPQPQLLEWSHLAVVSSRKYNEELRSREQQEQHLTLHIKINLHCTWIV